MSFTHLPETELAWAAGFFDGEGYCGIRTNGKYFYMQIQISQNDNEVLERFKNAVGYGSITGPYNYKDKSKPMYYFSVRKQAEVILVMEKLYPLLSSIKQDQYIRCRVNAKEKVKNYNMLTKDQVLQIRSLYAAGNISMKDLGTKFNCSMGHISDIVNLRSWRDV